MKSSIIDPRKIALAPTPVSITCPMCGKGLGGLVITDPDLLSPRGLPLIEITITCASGLQHSGLNIHPLTAAELAAKRAIRVPDTTEPETPPAPVN
jgi:hypothetical protein